MSEDLAPAGAALAAGALGYVTRARAATELVPAVETALCGNRFISSSASVRRDASRNARDRRAAPSSHS